MRQTWRWFGPKDQVSLSDMRQAGVEGVVSALHHIPNGTVWSVEEIQKRQKDIETYSDGTPSTLTWDVVESLPVSEQIKRQSGDWRAQIENYKQSLRNLAECGLEIICYNFMPVLDWTRTDLGHTLGNGARCMRFDLIDFAIFDIHILRRDGAYEDFPDEIVAQAQERFAHMTDHDKIRLKDNVICGLPGAEQGYSLDDLKEQLALYDEISEEKLRQNQLDFIDAILPTAERFGLRMCCHPDDPPFSLLGLPRIMSTETDYQTLTSVIDSPSNGITLCAGSLGVRPDVDLPSMMRRLGDKVHFIHLRNVARETSGTPNSFHEASHLGGETDMVALVGAILQEEAHRRKVGRSDHSIPFRPDHGQDILSDLKTAGQPGYPAVGRLKGLAELRGIMTALSHQNTHYS